MGIRAWYRRMLQVLRQRTSVTANAIRRHPCLMALTRLVRLAVVSVLLFAILGLATGFLVSPFEVATKNESIPDLDVADTKREIREALKNQPKTRTRDILGRQAPRNGVFVGVALSGGGSRAANFSAAVLLELERFGLMEHVSAISAVSGGSVTAAYYGLHRGTHRWAEAEVRKALLQDFELRLVLQNIRHIAPYIWSDLTRSHIMATVFDQTLFNKATFADLGDADGYPKIILNATDLIARDVFSFTDRQFAELGSRLDTYPVALAVASSAAFPGVFHNVTLRNYRSFEAGDDHRWADAVLMDGGVVDNLGLGTLVRMAEQASPASQGCLLIVVNSQLSPFSRGSIRGGKDNLIDLVISTNALESTDVLYEFQHQAILKRLRLDAGAVSAIGHLRLFEQNESESPKHCRGKCECLVWHIAFDNLGSVIGDGANHRHDVRHFVNRIPTRFALKSPRCSAAKTQEALFEAAKILVTEDIVAIDEVCRWMAGTKLEKPAICETRAPFPPRERPIVCPRSDDLPW